MRVLTAGESHGLGNIAIVEGFPQGVKIDEKIINQELTKRMSGVGRGKRMSIEQDGVKIISGLRNKKTLGSPIAMVIKNKDSYILSQAKDSYDPITIPRPAHADLSGAFKYQEKDMRNILERASARSTVSQVCIGSICKQLLANFKISIASFTVSVGNISSTLKPKSAREIISKTKKSQLNCIDKAAEKRMTSKIKKCAAEGDTLGGVVEIWIDGLPPGIGSCMHFDKRLDAKLTYYLMSIQAVKGIEVGLGFEYSQRPGSLAHDSIYHSGKEGFFRKSNNSGGIEGGMSTGNPIVLRLAKKPIATLLNPLDSVDLISKRKSKAPKIRSDTCAIVALSVIAENMAALAISESFLDKFGSDSLPEITRNYNNYLNNCKKL